MAEHVCPWWVGYLLASPVRRLFENPRKILAGHVKAGMTVIDVGCAMGLFSLDAARMVGDSGRVVSVDLQERMIASLKRRADRAGLSARIETRVCSSHSLEIDDLAGKVDLALAFHVAHEVPDVPHFMREIHDALKPKARLYLAEPAGRVSLKDYQVTEAEAERAGLEILDHPPVWRSRTTLFRKV